MSTDTYILFRGEGGSTFGVRWRGGVAGASNFHFHSLVVFMHQHPQVHDLAWTQTEAGENINYILKRKRDGEQVSSPV